MMAKKPFDPTPSRRTLGEGLKKLRGAVQLSEIARRIPAARGEGTEGNGLGIERQALMELEGVNCSTCKGSGRKGKDYCDTCGGSGRQYKGNPTLQRIEEIASSVFGAVAEVVFVYPPDHPLAGQIIPGIAPTLEGEVRGDTPGD